MLYPESLIKRDFENKRKTNKKRIEKKYECVERISGSLLFQKRLTTGYPIPVSPILMSKLTTDRYNHFALVAFRVIHFHKARSFCEAGRSQ